MFPLFNEDLWEKEHGRRGSLDACAGLRRPKQPTAGHGTIITQMHLFENKRKNIS
jgi:hypothetical protein